MRKAQFTNFTITLWIYAYILAFTVRLAEGAENLGFKLSKREDNGEGMGSSEISVRYPKKTIISFSE